ncbi:hypothetical protein [Staphylococcus phage vB_SauH_DELF3]|nr:hypothetical protein [Staphylococcus phage vB_SauH_DELF3]
MPTDQKNILQEYDGVDKEEVCTPVAVSLQKRTEYMVVYTSKVRTEDHG